MYLRICESVNPYFAFSHGQNAAIVASDTMIGLPFISASDVTSLRGWVRSTCGSFWKIAITAFSGTFSRARFIAMKAFDPMPKSAAPPTSICGTFTLGPPSMMRTSSPCFL